MEGEGREGARAGGRAYLAMGKPPGTFYIQN